MKHLRNALAITVAMSGVGGNSSQLKTSRSFKSVYHIELNVFSVERKEWVNKLADYNWKTKWESPLCSANIRSLLEWVEFLPNLNVRTENWICDCKSTAAPPTTRWHLYHVRTWCVVAESVSQIENEMMAFNSDSLHIHTSTYRNRTKILCH